MLWNLDKWLHIQQASKTVQHAVLHHFGDSMFWSMPGWIPSSLSASSFQTLFCNWEPLLPDTAEDTLFWETP